MKRTLSQDDDQVSNVDNGTTNVRSVASCSVFDFKLTDVNYDILFNIFFVTGLPEHAFWLIRFVNKHFNTFFKYYIDEHPYMKITKYEHDIYTPSTTEYIAIPKHNENGRVGSHKSVLELIPSSTFQKTADNKPRFRKIEHESLSMCLLRCYPDGARFHPKNFSFSNIFVHMDENKNDNEKQEGFRRIISFFIDNRARPRIPTINESQKNRNSKITWQELFEEEKEEIKTPTGDNSDDNSDDNNNSNDDNDGNDNNDDDNNDDDNNDNNDNNNNEDEEEDNRIYETFMNYHNDPEEEEEETVDKYHDHTNYSNHSQDSDNKIIDDNDDYDNDDNVTDKNLQIMDDKQILEGGLDRLYGQYFTLKFYNAGGQYGCKKYHTRNGQCDNKQMYVYRQYLPNIVPEKDDFWYAIEYGILYILEHKSMSPHGYYNNKKPLTNKGHDNHPQLGRLLNYHRSEGFSKYAKLKMVFEIICAKKQTHLIKWFIDAFPAFIPNSISQHADLKRRNNFYRVLIPVLILTGDADTFKAMLELVSYDCLTERFRKSDTQLQYLKHAMRSGSIPMIETILTLVIKATGMCPTLFGIGKEKLIDDKDIETQLTEEDIKNDYNIAVKQQLLNTIKSAMSAGRLNVLKWAIEEKGVEIPKTTIPGIYRSCILHILRDSPNEIVYVPEPETESNVLECMKYIYRLKNILPTTDHLRLAIINDYPQITQWFVDIIPSKFIMKYGGIGYYIKGAEFTNNRKRVVPRFNRAIPVMVRKVEQIRAKIKSVMDAFYDAITEGTKEDCCASE